MIFESKTVRRTINKAFLKEPIERGSFTVFKDALEQLSIKRKSQKAALFLLDFEIGQLDYELYGLSEKQIREWRK